MGIWIEVDLCNGCKRCIRTCPYGAIEMKGDKAQALSDYKNVLNFDPDFASAKAGVERLQQ